MSTKLQWQKAAVGLFYQSSTEAETSVVFVTLLKCASVSYGLPVHSPQAQCLQTSSTGCFGLSCCYDGIGLMAKIPT